MKGEALQASPQPEKANNHHSKDRVPELKLYDDDYLFIKRAEKVLSEAEEILSETEARDKVLDAYDKNDLSSQDKDLTNLSPEELDKCRTEKYIKILQKELERRDDELEQIRAQSGQYEDYNQYVCDSFEKTEQWFFLQGQIQQMHRHIQTEALPLEAQRDTLSSHLREFYRMSSQVNKPFRFRKFDTSRDAIEKRLECGEGYKDIEHIKRVISEDSHHSNLGCSAVHWIKKVDKNSGLSPNELKLQRTRSESMASLPEKDQLFFEKQDKLHFKTFIEKLRNELKIEYKKGLDILREKEKQPFNYEIDRRISVCIKRKKQIAKQIQIISATEQCGFDELPLLIKRKVLSIELYWFFRNQNIVRWEDKSLFDSEFGDFEASATECDRQTGIANIRLECGDGYKDIEKLKRVASKEPKLVEEVCLLINHTRLADEHNGMSPKEYWT